MIVTLKTQGLQTLEQIRAFVEGTEGVEFKVKGRQEAYDLITETLRRFRYGQRNKAERGLLKSYLGKVTGFSRAQMTRLVTQFQATRQLQDRRGPPAQPLARIYTAEDVRLLAAVDALHGQLSGPATRKLCERAFEVYGDRRFKRLAQISVGHLYNLRHSLGYRRLRVTVAKTRPTAVAIGERRKPYPAGRPGYLRVDSVHQGDQDGIKGLYLINLVDEVTQFQFVGAVERISERFLLPLLYALIQAFPFPIKGFHSDNGSEYLNHQVAGLLSKLQVEEFTKSRARQSNDNALVESKKGSVIRKHLGYAHIPGRYATQVNTFTQEVLSPYLNFHRPCFFPIEEVDPKGRVRKRYPLKAMMTPYDKLRSLPEAGQCLKAGVTFEQLDQIARAMSDNEAARRLNEARAQLFQTIDKTSQPAA
jgi:hypothetical protein